MPGPDIASLFPVTTTSPQETFETGRALAPHLQPGDVVGLYGELGAGKTQLIKGICDGSGCPDDVVHSPTFTIVNEYHAAELTIFHFDAYRVERLSEFYDLGYEDYFFGDGICLVEWADRVESLLPSDALRIQLRHLGASKRTLSLITGTV